MSDNPKVSVAMPVYNGEKYLSEAINSILNQTYSNLELIITDNASTDETPNIVKEIASRDDRVRYVHNGKNIGAAANYDRGFDLARGEYFKWHADDDVLSPDFLEHCVRALDENPLLGHVHTKTVGIDSSGMITDLAGPETPSVMTGDPTTRFTEMMKKSGSCFSIFGLYRSEQLRRSTLHRPYYGSDRALIIEMATIAPYEKIESGVFYNREHAGRSLNMASKKERELWQNGTETRSGSMQQIKYIMHLNEITKIHSARLNRFRCHAAIFAYLMNFSVLRQISMEALSFLSPNAADGLRRLKRRITRTA